MKAAEGLKRIDGRTETDLRSLKITAGVNPYAEGSAEVQLGSTKLLITSTIDAVSKDGPRADEAGRIYAQLNMLPRAMHVRIKDPELSEVVKLELQSLQQLVVRALRSAVKPQDTAAITLTLDCNIICSDAGIGSAAIAGSWVAMYQSLRWAMLQKLIRDDVYITRIACLSGGVIGSRVLLDLCAEEAAQADFTATFVFDDHSKLIDIRGIRETTSLEPAIFTSLLNAACTGAGIILKEQERAVLEMT